MAQSVENQEDRVNGGENGVCLGGENRGFWGFGWWWLVRRATCAAGVVCAAVRERSGRGPGVVRGWSGGGVLWVAFCWLLSPGTVCARRFCLRSSMWWSSCAAAKIACVLCVWHLVCVVSVMFERV